MPRLSDTLMKGSRNHANLRKYTAYLPTYNHRAIMFPNVLGNRVSGKRVGDKKDLCQDQMQIMMTCWKRNEYKENSCQEEVLRFAECVQKSKKAAAEANKFADTEALGVFSVDASGQKKINSKQVNKLLRMYPQPPYKVEITHAHGMKKVKPEEFVGKKEK